MQVITHQFITFGCDHGELEYVGRLVCFFLRVGNQMEEYECLACGFIVELEHGVKIKQCPSCKRFYDKVKLQVENGKSFTEITVSPTSKKTEKVELKESCTFEKECPFCSESIKDTAKKCKHCGEILDVVLRAADESKNVNNVFMNSSSAAVAVTEPKAFPHLLHFVLSLITGGLWIIVWVIHYLTRTR